MSMKLIVIDDESIVECCLVKYLESCFIGEEQIHEKYMENKTNLLYRDFSGHSQGSVKEPISNVKKKKPQKTRTKKTIP